MFSSVLHCFQSARGHSNSGLRLRHLIVENATRWQFRIASLLEGAVPLEVQFNIKNTNSC